MPNKKRPKTEFYLEEVDTTVIAKLAIGEKIILDFQNDDAPAIRVRSTKVVKQKIRDAASYWATRDWNHPTPASWLDFYAVGLQKNICKEIIEIRKSLRRIAAAMDGIKVANQIKTEILPDAERPGS